MKNGYLLTKKVSRSFGDIVILIPVLLILATPFAVSSELQNGVVTAKYFWFYFATLMFAGSSLFIIILKNIAFRVTRIDLAVLLFGVYTAFQFFVSHSPAIMQQSMLVLLLIAYFNFRLLFSAFHGSVKHVALLTAIIGGVEALWGLGQVFGYLESYHSRFGITGSFFNPGPYSGFLAMIFPLVVALWRNDYRGKVERPVVGAIRLYVLTLIAGSILMILPGGMSRTAWIAALLGCAVLFNRELKAYISGVTLKISLYKWIITFGGILLICAVLSGLYLIKKDSADGRFLIWKVSVDAICQHPFLGGGLGSFSGDYGMAQARYFANGTASDVEAQVAGAPEYGFNEYLQILSEWGLMGFAMFVVMVFLALKAAYKSSLSDHPVYKGVAASIIAIMVFALAAYPFRVLPHLILFVFLLSVCAGNDSTVRIIPKWGVVIVSLMLVVLSGVLINQRWGDYQAYRSWRDANFLYQADLFDDVADDYRELYPRLKDNRQFLFEYGRCLSKTGKYKESNEVLKLGQRQSSDPMFLNIMADNYRQMHQYRDAEACLRRSMYTLPNRHYPVYLLAKLYQETGQSDKAKKMAQMVLDKTAKVNSTAIRQMKIEMQQMLSKNNHKVYE